MKQLVKRIIFNICEKIVLAAEQKGREDIYAKFKFPSSVRFYNVSFDGNIEIGERTYINE